MLLIFLLIFFVVIILGWIILVILYSQKFSKLNSDRKNFWKNRIFKIENLDDYKKIIQYDSILHWILKDLWYAGSLWEQLKKKPLILDWNIDTIWKLHKLRNKLAHEVEWINWDNSKDVKLFRTILLEILE